MATFFPLPQRALVLSRKTHAPNFDEAGQLVKPEHESEAEGTTIKCLFYGMVGGKRGGARQEFDQTVAFYCEPSVVINEGDIVTNVTGPGAEAYEDGPFEVLRVTKVTSFSGKVHHLSCKLRGGTL